MTQPFILKLTDGTEEIDFISSYYRVMDGGFDVGMPRAKRELAFVRNGIWQPVSNNYEFREAKLRFAIRGDTRGDVITRLHKIERILRQISYQARPMAGRRGELSWAWDGSTDVTFFEVYGGDLQFPNDLMSVGKIHVIVGGQFMLPDCELTLQLSPMGYGISLHSGEPISVPLINPSVAEKTTDGVTVQNLAIDPTEQYNYVEIDGDDVPGSQPAITVLTLDTGSTYNRWQTLYMGLHPTPFPTSSQLLFDSADKVFSVAGSSTADGDCEGGSYHRIIFGTTVGHSFFSTIAWSLPEQVGLYYGFVHCRYIPTGSSFAIGVDDYVEFGIRYHEDYVTPNADQLTVPLGAIQLPPTGKGLADLGDINSSLWMGLWYLLDNEAGGTLGVDALTLMPITSGLRVLRTRVSHSSAGQFLDNGWTGVQAFIDGSTSEVSSPFYGLLDNLRLEPGVDQRIYFTSVGGSTFTWDRTRDFVVKLYAVPTYLTLAL